MSIVDLENVTNEELKKRVALLINIEDWAYKCSKYGNPKDLHKELRHDVSFTQEQPEQELDRL